MHPDDLKIIWICQDCDSHFIFYSDVIDHKEQTGHSKLVKNSIMSNESIEK